MLAYATRRLLMTIPVVAVVAVVVFALLYLTPGDPALVLAGDGASAADVARIRTSLGLDQAPAQRFALWVWRGLHGDLGASVFTGQPVLYMIGQRAGPTLSLLALSVAISVAAGVPLGVLAAARPGGVVDRVLMGVTAAGYSVPVFVAGYLLAWLFASRLHWLPVQGYVAPEDGLAPFLRHLVLPALSLSLFYATLIAGVTRASMLEALSQDYIRTAAAKGLDQTTILFRHALRNAAVPVATVIGSGVASLVGGAVITESVFAIPGVGGLTIDAVLHRDYPLIQGVVLVCSLGYVLINLAVDLSYAVLDPRIRY